MFYFVIYCAFIFLCHKYKIKFISDDKSISFLNYERKLNSIDLLSILYFILVISNTDSGYSITYLQILHIIIKNRLSKMNIIDIPEEYEIKPEKIIIINVISSFIGLYIKHSLPKSISRFIEYAIFGYLCLLIRSRIKSRDKTFELMTGCLMLFTSLMYDFIFITIGLSFIFPHIPEIDRELRKSQNYEKLLSILDKYRTLKNFTDLYNKF